MDLLDVVENSLMQKVGLTIISLCLHEYLFFKRESLLS